MRLSARIGILLSACCLSLPLLAQTASVNGRVVDVQHAVVPGSSVTLHSLDTKIDTRTVSDSAGNFILPPVVPGHYELAVQAAGFSLSVVHGITLELGDSRAITVELRAGGSQQTITVTAAPPELSTDRADRSLLIEPEFVASVPLDVRNPLQMIDLSPGVIKGDDGLSGQNSTSQSRTNTFRINGAKGATTDVLIDGAANTTAYYNQDAGIPGVEAVREFRVYTDAYAPEFGRTSGGIVTYGLKSGTNQFHGSVFEYFRDSALDANGYNANKAGLAKPSFSRNQFGVALGGPIKIPHLYDGHDKTFFFFAYEGLRDSAAGSFTGSVPTDLERKGDFSQTTDSKGNPVVIYDPSTTTLQKPGSKTCTSTAVTATQTVYCRSQISFNGRKNVIDPARINPIALKLLSYYPEPNQPGVGLSHSNNYFSNAPGKDNNNNFDVKIDHRINDHHNVFGHFNYFSNWIYQNDYYGNGLAAVNSNDRIPGFNIGVNHVWTIRPDLIFEHHLSWAHSESNRSSPLQVAPTDLGFSSAIAPGLTASLTPQLSIDTISDLGNNYPFEANKSSVWQYAADVSWLKRNHTFKFGIDLRRYPVQLYDPQQLEISASDNFTGGPNANTASTPSGHGAADLLLGQATVTSGYAPQTNSAHNYIGLYAQDIIKLTPKLTLTAGLRYSLETGDVENHNQLNYLDTTSPSPLAGQVPGFPNLTGGVGIPGLNGTSRRIQSAEMLHFDPRIGVSYQYDSKTVIHSGFGIFHHPMGPWEQFPNAYGANRESTSIDAAPDGVTPLYNLSNPFPQGLPQPWGSAAGLSIALGHDIGGVLRKQSIPYQINWSFDIQRELPARFVVTAAYAGNAGVHLLSPIQLNQLPDSALALGSKLLSVVPNPFYGVITDPSSTLSAATIQYGQLLRAHPQFLNTRASSVGVGHSSYHAAQVTAERRMGRSLAVIFGYTFSKAIDNVGEMTSVAGTKNGFQDNNCFSCDRSRSGLNQTHTIRWSTLYQLPFGSGQRWVNHGFFSPIVGGWRISGIVKYGSGQPLAVTSPNNSNSLGGGSGMRPMVTGIPATLPGGPQIKLGGQYFNPAAFSRTPSYQFGNAPRYLPDVDNPPNKNFDALIEKNTQLYDRYALLFRVEMFNAFNMVRFAGPTTDVTSVNFGTIASLSQTNDPREVQLSLRLRF